MKITVKDDIVINSNPKDGIDVKRKPRHLGWDRIRYNKLTGELVDLEEAGTKWIDKNGIMHCLEVENSQPVDLKYSERKRLTKSNGQWRLMSEAEYEEKISAGKEELILHKRKKNYSPNGDVIDALLRYLEPKEDLTEELQEIINKWKETKEKFPKGV